jgi:hypothetical protein
MCGCAANASTVSAPPEAHGESAAEFQRRLEACAPADRAAHMSLTAWAVEQGLVDHADQLCRDVLDADPTDDQARAMLVRIATGRKLPRNSPALTSAIDVLPARFAFCESAHFVVVSDGGLIRSRQHAELLERAEHQFQRFAARLNLRPLPLQHKLVCVLFRSKDDYRAFAVAQDGVEAEWVTGYYAPAHDRIVFFDAEFAPPPAEARVMLDQAGDDITTLEMQSRDLERSDEIVAAEALRRRADDLRRQRDLANRQLDSNARANAIATTIHEATHQLLYHTRVQGIHVRSPLWISEGLATNFETDSPQQAFGPDHEYAPRREDFAGCLADNRLLPLAELVQIDGLSGADEGRAMVVYAQSYALVKWMCRFRREQLRQYLELVRAEPPGQPTSDRHLELFQIAFGDITALERAWLRHERDTESRSASAQSP